MKKYFMILMLSLIVMLPIRATAFDTNGMSVSAGYNDKSDGIVIGSQSYSHDFSWYNVGMFGRNYIGNCWYVDYELDVGYLQWRDSGEKVTTVDYVHYIRCHPPTPVYTTNKKYKNGDTLSLEFRAMFMKRIRPFDIGLGGGFAVLADTDEIINLTDDGFYGLITGCIRLPLANDMYGIDLRADHISSVFGHDAGMNTWKLRFYAMF